jgi:hypothetical protein
MNWFLTVAVGAFVCWLWCGLVLTLLFERAMDETDVAVPRPGGESCHFHHIECLSILGLITLNFQRVEDDLLRSVDEIKTLRGIIPYARHARRSGRPGYWKQLEAYMKDHADITFSHGICPECMEKLYSTLKIGEKDRAGEGGESSHDG